MKLRKRTRARLLRIGVGATLAAAAATACVNALVGWVSGGGPWLLDPRHFSDKAQALAAYARHRPGCMILSEQDPLAAVPRAAARSRLDPELLEALVLVESGGRAHRISPTGACGPAQLKLSTARALGVSDPFDPPTGVDGGARYLREQLDRFHGNRALALAAYNAGPGAVHGVVPQNGETEVYVLRVLSRWRQLRAERRRGRRPAGRSILEGPGRPRSRKTRLKRALVEQRP